MPIDYPSANRILELSFEKLDKPSASMGFPSPGTLSSEFTSLLRSSGMVVPVLPHDKCQLLASAGVEMWHRAIHSFLWSVALTDSSPLWASISGYYASHFVMRAFAHSMGFYKSFIAKKPIQIVLGSGQFVLSEIDPGKNHMGEHAFYWKIIKGHPNFASNILFRENTERNKDSDASHRNFANYADHIGDFNRPFQIEQVSENVTKISHIKLHSIDKPSRENYPDIQNIQILAFQRIVAFHDFLEERIPKNRFWRAHRRPAWCKDVMLYQVEDPGLEMPTLK